MHTGLKPLPKPDMTRGSKGMKNASFWGPMKSPCGPSMSLKAFAASILVPETMGQAQHL